MTNHPAHEKFPKDSANRDYDLFEEFPDGSTVWRASTLGMENVEMKLLELSSRSRNKFFALHLDETIRPVFRPMKSLPRHEARRTG